MSLVLANKSEVFSGNQDRDWQPRNQDEYRIEILTIAEQDGRFSTIALNLPGAGSCGDSKELSIANAKEAIKDALETYKESGDPIPWAEVTPDKVVRGEYKVIWIHV